MEAADGCRAGAAGRGGELRGRAEDAADEPVLGVLPPPRRCTPVQHGLALLQTRRDDVTSHEQADASSNAATQHAATRAATTSPSTLNPTVT